jgi:hypothetical protein
LGGPDGKLLLAAGVTGYSDADPDEVITWEYGRYRRFNLACAPVGISRLDVATDKHGRMKRGLDTIAEHEARLGPLPPTVRPRGRSNRVRASGGIEPHPTGSDAT